MAAGMARRRRGRRLASRLGTLVAHLGARAWPNRARGSVPRVPS
jgi:hypothetical protein